MVAGEPQGDTVALGTALGLTGSKGRAGYGAKRITDALLTEGVRVLLERNASVFVATQIGGFK